MTSPLKKRNFWFMMVMDIVVLVAANALAYLLRFDGRIPPGAVTGAISTMAWLMPLKLSIFIYCRLYKGMWRYTSLHDLINITRAVVISSTGGMLIILIFYRFEGFSRGVYLIDMVLSLFLIAGYRIAIRLFYTEKHRICRKTLWGPGRATTKKILIVGAGDAGEKLLREIHDNSEIKYDVVGFIDDHPSKVGRQLHGVPVLGTTREMFDITREDRIDEIIISIPSATTKQMRNVVEFCKSTGLPFKTVPGMGELIDGRFTVSAIREVRYDDLLKREEIRLDLSAIAGYLGGKRVMVSGGAGSIGSELCRQVAGFNPQTLIIVDRNESGAYEIDLDLRARFPRLRTEVVLCPIQSRRRMEKVFSRYQPQVVFHAAAYKHVPLMEQHPWEAVYNNIVGSRVLLELCMLNQVDRCVVVSTDKAVRPTNVMGASKRVIELLMQGVCNQAASNNFQTRFTAVRFGNVIGSIGSVIPLFKKQIARGGPVTVTDPEITRFSMTIPEAVGLILQTGVIGRGGDIFVLKMGLPVRIAELAHDLITLSGFEPDVDIPIEYTGLRPGEKLFEELITVDEGIYQTEHQDIMVLKSDFCQLQPDLNDQIDELVRLACQENEVGIKIKLKEIVPEYQPDWTCVTAN